VTPVWPPNGLRDRLVARGQKRLCITGIDAYLLIQPWPDIVNFECHTSNRASAGYAHSQVVYNNVDGHRPK